MSRRVWATVALAATAAADPCSLNGDYDPGTGSCTCDPGWTGAQCSQLKLLPVDPARMGYRNLSMPTWSGTAPWPKTDEVTGATTWHWFLGAEAKKGANEDFYLCDSNVVHLTGPSQLGPWALKETILKRFHLSPFQTEHNGTYLIFTVGYDGPELPSVEACAKNDSYAPGYNKSLNTIRLSHSSDLDANVWETTDVTIIDPYPGKRNRTAWDCYLQNPTAYIFPNGTTILMYRATPCEAPGAGSFEHIGIAVAPHWKGPYRHQSRHPVFGLGVINEDPFLWRNRRGFHALLHAQTDPATHKTDAALGYSLDGLQWAYVAKPVPYGPTFPWTNGTTTALVRRQKPALIFDAENNPAFLITGVDAGGTGRGTTWESGWTLVQPIDSSH